MSTDAASPPRHMALGKQAGADIGARAQKIPKAAAAALEDSWGFSSSAEKERERKPRRRRTNSTLAATPLPLGIFFLLLLLLLPSDHWVSGVWGKREGGYIYVRSLRFKAGALRSCPRLLRYPNYYELRACARRYNSSWNVTVLPRVGTHLEQKKEKIGLDFFPRVTYTYSYLIMV